MAARASALLDVGRAEEALRLLAPAAPDSGDPQLYVLMILALSRLDRRADAVAVAGTAVADVGPHPEVTRQAAYAYLRTGDVERAAQAAEAAVSAAPQWVPGLLALAEVAAAAGDRDTAGAAVHEALHLAPDDPVGYLVAAEVAMTGRSWISSAWRVARGHYRTALGLDPSNVDARRGLGNLEEQRSRYGRAARWYAEALTLRPGDAVLIDRVRALYGRLLGVVAASSMMLAFVVLMAFLIVADPPPGEAPPSGPGGVLATTAPLIVIGGFVGWLLVSSLRATPRTVLNGLRSDVRSYRRAGRCWRATIAQVVILAGTALVAGLPIGPPADRLGEVMLIWLLGMVVAIVNLILLRVTFGYGGVRPVRPRDLAAGGSRHVGPA